MTERHGPRFFVEGAYSVGDIVMLDGADARKATLVLRLRVGDAVEVFDSAGRAFAGVLVTNGARSGVRIESVRAAARESALEMTLAQAVPKGAKMDFIVEKATELGVARIVPLLTERTLGDPGAAKVERWRRLARAAAQQSGRAVLPSIEEPQTFARFVAAPNGARVLLPWELAPRTALREQLPALLEGATHVAVVIGPEGGFAHAEVDAARAAGAAVVSLGARILRTETAGLVVLSALAYAAGEL
jgi:16S rRNA (uracil1498-N3)-methyltransferase